MPEITTDRPIPPQLQPRVRRKLASGISCKPNQTNVWEARKLTQKSCRYHELGQFKYRYTPEGQYQTVTFPSGQSRNYSYDWAGRLLQLANLHPTTGNLATYSYGYDIDWATGLKTRKGQRTSMTADVPAQGFAGALTKYYYDVHYQLTGADYPSAAPFNGEIARWTYDAIGNRTSETVNGVVRNYTYRTIGANSKNSQELISADLGNGGATGFSYDAIGGMTTRTGPGGTYTFGFDLEPRLVSIESQTGSTYSYDYSGRRVSSVETGTQWVSVFDGQNRIRDLGGASFLFGPDIDQPLAMVRGTGTYYYVTDTLDSTALLTAPSGEPANSYVYDSWGDVRTQVGSVENPFTYTGREVADAGLMFSRARFYDPRVGRFTQSDPIGLRGGPSLYGYANGDPVQWVDPYGLFAWPNKYEDLGCCELLKQIKERVKELRRLFENQTDPSKKYKRLGVSPFDTLKKWWGHAKQYRNRQGNLKKLFDAFNRKPCDPQGLPKNASEWLNRDYPISEEFLEQYGENLQQNSRDLFDWFNEQFENGMPMAPMPFFPIPVF